jgi:hypothetical protein
MTSQLDDAGQVRPGSAVAGLSEGGVVVRVELFLDPACLWSWLTSRWLVEVAPERSLEVGWRPYSLLLRDGPEGLEDWKAVVWGASLRAVRVMQALDAEDSNGVRGFYEAVVASGIADYHAGRPPFQDLAGALAAAGLPSTYAAAADDAAWDQQIRRSMAEAFAVVGEGVGTPALVLQGDPPVGLLGPLVSAPPTRAEALRLWDAVVTFATVPAVLELSRPRPPRPTIPELRW